MDYTSQLSLKKERRFITCNRFDLETIRENRQLVTDEPVEFEE
jgi:hypothetical protein